MPEEIITDRLVFRPIDGYTKTYGAVDADNVEYFVEEPLDPAWSGSLWNARMQRRVAWDSVSQAIGQYGALEEACWACDAADPREAGLI